MNPSTNGSNDGTAIYLPRAGSAIGPAIAAPSLAFTIIVTIVIVLIDFDSIPAGVCIALTLGAGLTCYLLGVLSKRDQGFLRFGEEGITEIRSGGRSRGDLVVVRTERWSSACLATEQDIELLRERGWLKT